MKRRQFGLAAAALAAPAIVFAQGKPPEDGVQYRTLDRRVPVDAPAGKIEVVDFFWYSCPHCNAFEPTLQAWIDRQPPDVVVRRIPAGFRDDMAPQQRLFYTLEAMGKLPELHAKVFHAIHREGVRLNSEEDMVAWVQKQGVDPARFKAVYESFAVSAKQRHAVEVQNAYNLEGVPAMGVAGRYYTDGTLAGDNPRMLQVVDYLVARTRKGA